MYMKTIGIILSLVLGAFGCHVATAQQDSSKAMKQQKNERGYILQRNENSNHVKYLS